MARQASIASWFPGWDLKVLNVGVDMVRFRASLEIARPEGRFGYTGIPKAAVAPSDCIRAGRDSQTSELPHNKSI